MKSPQEFDIVDGLVGFPNGPADPHTFRHNVFVPLAQAIISGVITTGVVAQVVKLFGPLNWTWPLLVGFIVTGAVWGWLLLNHRKLLFKNGG